MDQTNESPLDLHGSVIVSELLESSVFLYFKFTLLPPLDRHHKTQYSSSGGGTEELALGAPVIKQCISPLGCFTLGIDPSSVATNINIKSKGCAMYPTKSLVTQGTFSIQHFVGKNDNIPILSYNGISK